MKEKTAPQNKLDCGSDPYEALEALCKELAKLTDDKEYLKIAQVASDNWRLGLELCKAKENYERTGF